jgi:nucleotidyltransferase/DNA polymerase involved in DNA repair
MRITITTIITMEGNFDVDDMIYEDTDPNGREFLGEEECEDDDDGYSCAASKLDMPGTAAGGFGLSELRIKRNTKRPTSNIDRLSRVIGHIDMDCFYVQVERSINPSLLEKPVAVVQYNPFGDLTTLPALGDRVLKTRYNGSLIAVSYEARARGVKRIMRGVEARATCPELIMIQVPMTYQKADLTIYREAGERVVDVLKRFGCVVEKASVDEVFVDLTDAVQQQYQALLSLEPPEMNQRIQELVALTDKCRIAGEDKIELAMSRRALSRGHIGTDVAVNTISRNDLLHEVFGKSLDFSSWSINDKLLMVGASLIEKMRRQIFEEVGFTCSGGVAHNKMLSKIASGMHKPNQLTIVPHVIVEDLMMDMPISRVPGFGGKLGSDLAKFNGTGVSTFGEIRSEEMKQLVRSHFGPDVGSRVINVAYGIDDEHVRDRYLAKTIGCSKNIHKTSEWLPSTCFKDGELDRWLRILAQELYDRIQADMKLHHRWPKSLAAGVAVLNFPSPSSDGKSKDNAPEVGPSTSNADMPSSLTAALFGWSSSGRETASRIGPMKQWQWQSVDTIVAQAMTMLRSAFADNRSIVEPWKIYSLSMSATHFEPLPTASNSISKYFGPAVEANVPTDATRTPAVRTTEEETDITSSSKKSNSGIMNWVKSNPSDLADGCISTDKILTDNSSDNGARNASLDHKIDMDVWNSLPVEIQRELKFSLRQQFSANSGDKRKSQSDAVESLPKKSSSSSKKKEPVKEHNILQFFGSNRHTDSR